MSNLSRESINALADRWAEIMWAISWQFCVLGVVVMLIHWLLRRTAPSWRYWLWQILAIKLLLMPFWTAALPWPTALADSVPESAPIVAKTPDITSPVVPQPSKKLSEPLVVSATSKLPIAPVIVPELSEQTVSSPSFQPFVLDERVESHTDQIQLKRNREQPILVAPAALDLSPVSNASLRHEPVSPARAQATVPSQSWLLLVETRIYPVRDLIVGNDDFDILIAAIRAGVAPDSWYEMGRRSISKVPATGSLVVCQSPEVHADVLRLLRVLREAKDLPVAGAGEQGQAVPAAGVGIDGKPTGGGFY